jgi:hypothetical protein
MLDETLTGSSNSSSSRGKMLEIAANPAHLMGLARRVALSPSMSGFCS